MESIVSNSHMVLKHLIGVLLMFNKLCTEQRPQAPFLAETKCWEEIREIMRHKLETIIKIITFLMIQSSTILANFYESAKDDENILLTIGVCPQINSIRSVTMLYMAF